uniref:Uncharacterized protein n=1 Tax=Aegilops tauschii subsp. strangulata TaxID=200361 RepID=A0A453SQQ3_AEGTS
MRECLLLCEGRQMGKLLRVLRPPLPHPVSIGAACRSARGGGCGGAGQHPSLFTSHPALVSPLSTLDLNITCHD